MSTNYRDVAMSRATRMVLPLGQIPGLSEGTVAALRKEGYTHVGEVVIRMANNVANPIKGIGPRRIKEIHRAFADFRVWSTDGESPWHYVASKGFVAGIQEGVAKEREKQLTQRVTFRSALVHYSLERLKDMVIKAYSEKAAGIGLKLFVVHNVVGIGEMTTERSVVFPLDEMAKMINAWDPHKPVDLKCNAVLSLFNGGELRDTDISINLNTCEGSMLLKPPDENARRRIEQYFTAHPELRPDREISTGAGEK